MAIAARCLPLHVYSKRDPLGREMKVKDAQPLKRENVRRPMVFDGGFRFREADAETDGKCHRGQGR